MILRTMFAIAAGKIILILSGLFKVGSGSTWPGHAALKIFPSAIKDLSRPLRFGSVVVTGTNGKTTTVHMITRILNEAGFKVTHNKGGANLMSGVASCLIKDSDLLGRASADIGIFEADEGAFPDLLKNLTPKLVVLLNLSRDQLDRYGETDITLERWSESLSSLNTSSVVLINSQDNRLSKLEKVLREKGLNVKYFGKDVPVAAGEYRKLNEEAAKAVCLRLGVSSRVIGKGLSIFGHAFGRGEEVSSEGRVFRVLLSKNPKSFNENLKLLIKEKNKDPLFFIINDNIPDGRDVSWIYDIDPSYLRDVCKNKEIFVSGGRAFDMALRLKYAEVQSSSAGRRIKVKSSNRLKDLRSVIKDIIKVVPKREKIIVLPTYSAMLQIRKILVGRAIG